MRSAPPRSPFAAELRLTAAEGAHLRVVQLLNPARGAVLRHELSAQLAEHAKLDLISSSSATALFTPTTRSPLRATARRCAPTSATSPRRSDTADIDLTVEQLGKKHRERDPRFRCADGAREKRSSAAPLTSARLRRLGRQRKRDRPAPRRGRGKQDRPRHPLRRGERRGQPRRDHRRAGRGHALLLCQPRHRPRRRRSHPRPRRRGAARAHGGGRSLSARALGALAQVLCTKEERE